MDSKILDEKVVGWSFFDILQSEIMKRYTQELMNPISKQIYEFTYPYVWMICLYSIFLFVLILANFLLLVKIYWRFCYISTKYKNHPFEHIV